MGVVNYGLSDEYEQVTAAMLCRSPDFWKRVGRFMKSGGFRNEEAALIHSVVQAHVEQTNVPPESWLTVREVLLRAVNDGSVDPKAARHAKVFVEQGFDLVEDAGITVDDAVSVVSVPVRSEEERLLLDRAVSRFGKGADIAELSNEFGRLGTIGVVAREEGVELEDAVDDIANRRKQRRTDLGIDELDMRLGGIEAGSQTVIVGGPGDGKSMALSQMAAHALNCSLNVAIATLEVSRNNWQARLLAAVLGLPSRALQDGIPQTLAKAKVELQNVLPVLGRCNIAYFTPGATTVSEIFDWVKVTERSWGERVDVLVVDYADKLAPDGKQDKANTYHSMNMVYEKLRIWAEQSGAWMFTASQSKSRASNDRKRKRDVDDASDSMGKSRVCDVMLTLNTVETDGDREVTIFVAKNRNGEARFSVGPLMTDFENGRLTK